MNSELTSRQLEAIKYICQTGMEEWRSLTYSELATKMGLSRSATLHHIHSLRAKGYLQLGRGGLGMRVTDLAQERWWEEWIV